MSTRTAITTTAYIAAIVVANWLTTRYGFVPVGLGPVVLSATAGTYAAGATFTLRDDMQEHGGNVLVVAAIVAGSIVSWLVAAPAIAMASFAAFMLAEACDLAVYTPMRRRHWHLAVLLSGLVGSVVDTLLFLWLAFGTESITGSSVAGQVLAKMLAVTVVWGLLVVARSRR